MRNLFYASANEWINQRIIKHANTIYRLGGYQERVPNGEACATLSIDGVWSGIQQLIHQRPTTELRDETLDSVLPFRFHIRFDLIPNRPSLFLPPPLLPPLVNTQWADRSLDWTCWVSLFDQRRTTGHELVSVVAGTPHSCFQFGVYTDRFCLHWLPADDCVCFFSRPKLATRSLHRLSHFSTNNLCLVFTALFCPLILNLPFLNSFLLRFPSLRHLGESGWRQDSGFTRQGKLVKSGMGGKEAEGGRRDG